MSDWKSKLDISDSAVFSAGAYGEPASTYDIAQAQAKQRQQQEFVNNIPTHTPPRTRGILLLALCLLLNITTFVPPANANQVCSRSEIRASERYYDDRGYPRGASVAHPPKRCKTGKNIPRFAACPNGDSIDLAAQFLSVNGRVVTWAAQLSRRVYQADTAFKLRAKKNPLEVAPGHFIEMSEAEMEREDGSWRVVRVVSIPSPGSTNYYWDPMSDLVFAVSSRPESPGKGLVYVAFRGTSEVFKHMIGTNLPEMGPGNMPTPMYVDADYAAAMVRGAIARASGLDEQTVHDDPVRTGALRNACNSTVLFTGHSLGGGLAIRAATSNQRTYCQRKSDALIVFNPATPNWLKHTLVIPKGGAPSLMTAAIFQNAIDPVKVLEGAIPTTAAMIGSKLPGAQAIALSLLSLSTTGAAGLLNSLASTTQVIHFGGMRFGDSTSAHSMDAMANELMTFIPDMQGPSVSPHAQQRLCDWHTPL